MGVARGPLLVLAVVGRKGVGKTKVVEELVRALRARGFKVATAKHVPEEGFSLDTPGKDSWRHAEAGAKAVTIAAPGEVTTIRRVKLAEAGLDTVIAWASENCDILVMEGFSSLAGDRPDVLKVAVVRGPEEARQVKAEGRLKPLIAFVGPGKAEELKPPYFSFDAIDALVGLLEEITERRARRAPGARLIVGGKEIPLKPFVSELLRKLVLAFASSLRDVKVNGDEGVVVLVEKR